MLSSISFSVVIIISLCRDVLSASGINQIEHIIIFMQENRAYDHYFGSMRGIRGFNDRAAVPLRSGLNAFYQPIDQDNLDDYMLPFRVDPSKTNCMCMDAPEMYYPTDINMWNGGRMDSWNTARDPGYGMSYFTRADLPYYYTLYDHFVSGDQYFQSTFTCTNPNRMHLFTGSNGLSVGEEPVLENDEPDPGFTWITAAEILEAHNISWRVYQQHDNFDDNAFAWFKNFQDAEEGDVLYDKGMKRQIDAIEAFGLDLKSHALPQVSWVIAPTDKSEHAVHHPAAGEDWTARLLKKLEQNPDMYAKSVFILNYDEGGQFYDHAWTPTPPLSESEGISTVTVEGEINTDVLTDVPAPIGLGFRVPLLIISPWTRGDIVVSEIFDHTSVLKFLEERFGLQVPTISPWRRAMVGNLLSAFDFDHPDYSWPQNLPDTSDYVKEAEIECLTLPDVVIPSEQTMPVQEPGTKVSKALPYEFLVRDTMDFNIGSINITISNVGKAGAPFVSYDVIQIESVNPRQYAVEAGKQISDALYVPLSANHSYSFYLLGANGFVRTFAGIFDFSTRVSSHLSYDYDADKSNVVLHMQNDNTEDVEFVVVDNCYGLLPSPKSFHVSAGSGAIFELDVLTTGNWYDLTVSLAFNASLAYENGSLFERRFMGRMETGKDTISDPCMAEGKPGLPLLKRDAGGVGRVIQAPQNHPLLPEKLTRLSRVESRAAKRNKDAQFHYVQVEAV